MGAEALAEVPVQQITEVDEILFRQGLVQPQLDPRRFQLFGRGTLARPLDLRVGRDHTGDKKSDGDHA